MHNHPEQLIVPDDCAYDHKYHYSTRLACCTFKYTPQLNGRSDRSLYRCGCLTSRNSPRSTSNCLTCPSHCNSNISTGQDYDAAVKGRNLLLQVIPHINPNDIGELKEAILNGNKEKREGDDACNSYLEVILKLKVWHPQSVTWDEIDSLAASQGPHLLSAQDDAVLVNIHQLWHSLLPVTCTRHIFFTLISLQFGSIQI